MLCSAHHIPATHPFPHSTPTPSINTSRSRLANQLQPKRLQTSHYQILQVAHVLLQVRDVGRVAVLKLCQALLKLPQILLQLLQQRIRRSAACSRSRRRRWPWCGCRGGGGGGRGGGAGRAGGGDGGGGRRLIRLGCYELKGVDAVLKLLHLLEDGGEVLLLLSQLCLESSVNLAKDTYSHRTSIAFTS